MIAFDAPLEEWIGAWTRIDIWALVWDYESIRVVHLASSDSLFRTLCVWLLYHVRKTQSRSVVLCVGGDVSAGLICNNINTYLCIASRNYHLGCSGSASFWGANLFGRLFTDSCWLTAINKLFLNAITVSWCIVRICARMLFFFFMCISILRRRISMLCFREC
jgi:hypothetical protein